MAIVPTSKNMKRSSSEPAGRDRMRQAGAAFAGMRKGAPARLLALDPSSHQHHHNGNGPPLTGAGARLLGRVRDLRAGETAAKNNAPPKLWGTVISHAEPVEGFAVPKNLRSAV